MKWEQHQIDMLKYLWHEGVTPKKIGQRLSPPRSRAAVIGKSRVLNLHFKKRPPMRLTSSHRAVIEARTLFPSRVSLPRPGVTLLKRGSDTRKLGHEVAKGRWRGMPIYSLTLEERATCPRSCKVFNTCYGNRMWMARRWKAGPELEAALNKELADLQRAFPGGFVLRLHILGDFYSPEYVALWRSWLRKYPALNVFGYTAWANGTPIGDAISSLRNNQWERFSVRTSGAKEGVRTLVIPSAEKAGDAIVCPAQTDDTTSCATCGLCWHSKRAVAFLEH
jgi:hypothetical protein